MSEQCRSRDEASRLRCERTRGHDGWHRAETGEPIQRFDDGSGHIPMAVWA